MRYLFIFTAFCLIIVSNSCFGSSQRTSDIVKCITYSNDEGDYMILHELVYHPTNKNYQKGNFTSVGYIIVRLSVYDLNTGRLLVQKQMGSLSDNKTMVLLGCVDDYILIYSSFENEGMIALNIQTLDSKVFFSNYMINRNFGSKMYSTNWRTMYEYFGYNPFSNEIIFTDSLKNKYATNLNKYNLKTSDFQLKLNKRSDYFSTKTNFNSNFLTFGYGIEQCIEINNVKAKPAQCFNDGYFLMEQNIMQQFDCLYQNKEELNNALNESVEKTEILKQANNNYYKVIQAKVDSLNIELSRNKYQLDNLLKGSTSSEILIKPYSNAFLIVHKEKNEPDALLSISRMEVENNNIFFKHWTCTIPGMYYNLSTASNSKDFNRLFPLGLPDSEFIHFEVINDKLLIIYLLQMCMVDLPTGEIIWKSIL